MKINIRFGQPLGRALLSCEAVPLGTEGMLAFLEGRLGLTGDAVSQPERNNQYRLKCETYFAEREATGDGKSDVWAAASFAIDYCPGKNQ